VTATEVISSVFLLAGAALSFLAGVGVLRLPDVFARMHAATKPATLGLVLLAIGAAFAVGSVAEWLTMSLVVALQFLTAPAGAHLVGRVAARSRVATEHLVLDELPGADDR
jgi:multicomponent Na+:H+ antiporter subunit G